ncbi:MAG: type IV pilus twitching motility protein PilT [Deltaproteobacteria bacterium]|jgi:twitching motility protein PilT|nr:type IV pilus twitching motility protein PilT [Deltaproteobacteria bacterium]
MAKIDELFKLMVQKDASDLHLVAGSPPYMRISGEMEKLDMPTVTAQDAQDLIFEICNDKQKKEFITNWELDFAYTNEPIGRFRVNVFMQRKGIGVVCRVIPTKIKTAEQLGLPNSLLEMINCHKGLICVTGPTGSGKSTTLAALIHHINANQQSHILTIEDPIEFVHPSLKSLVNQREVHNHSKSFANALKAALREDPDVILVGEMRDLETISLAISAAETGHLVFGTLHTNNAHKTVDRIIDVFPGDRQSQIRVQLSESLRGVISQSLLPKVGGGRVAVQEVMFCNKAIANLIREGKTFQIPSTMQTGKNQGMVTYDSAVEALINRGLLAKDVGMEFLGKSTTATGGEEKGHGGGQSAVLGGSAASTPTPPPSGITMQPAQTGPAAALGNLASRFKKSS